MVYATGIGETAADRAKVVVADELVASALIDSDLVLPVQVCLEFHRVLVRKRRLSPVEASQIVREFSTTALLVASDGQLLDDAFDLASRHGLQTYDAMILTAAASAQCDVLYSEDMQHGFVWRDTMVVNPFA